MHIQFDEAGVAYADRVALKPLTLHVSERRVGVIGLNGSGKTTFARLINGLVLPSSGRVLTNGHDTRTEAANARAVVGYVFQNPANQIVLPLVRDDIALGLQVQALARPDVDQTVKEVLERLHAGHLYDRRAHELSGGEVQLAALASVLVMKPDIVILDEPTNQLDLRNRNLVERTLHALPENVIVVTHDLSLLTTFERVLLFHEGKLIGDGEAAATIDRYLALVA